MARALSVLVLLTLLAPPTGADSFLFDASKREMAANSDWILDADAWNQSMPSYPCTGNTNEANPARFPTPDQSLVTPATPETYWTGAVSAWGIELVKAGHSVETLPAGGAITYGDGGNPQDLGNYDVFIVPEPQNPFTPAEKTAILNFVTAGGGLFMVADHETSDRDCDGWDSPAVFNDLTGATGPSAAGLFGIWFRVDGSSVKPSEDWFDDPVNDNVETDPSDPIINGPFGSGAGGLGFFGATSMDINPLDNPTVTAHVWRTGQPHNNLRVTFATAAYGSGRVAAIGDSSPADDGTGDSGDTLYPGWDKASGGVNNREIHLNASHWLSNPVPDTTPPVIESGPTVTVDDCSAIVSWTTDEPATTVVDYGLTAAYGQNVTVPGYRQSHQVELVGLPSMQLHHYQVSSEDTVGNGPTQSADDTFTTDPGAAPLITVAPVVGPIGGTSATVSWTTDEPATSTVEYGPTASYGSSTTVPGFVRNHQVALSGLTPEQTYHFRVLSLDSCGQGPATSGDDTFTTGPAEIDVSGWVLKQFNSTQTFVIPADTKIPSGGYLVIARDATRGQFEGFFPAMPAATVFLNSNGTGSCPNGCLPQVNGGETFELWDTSSLVDGPTIAMSSNNAYQRINPGDPAGSGSSWNTVPEASADPGQGAGTPTGSGVRINEMADASDYTKEFVELYYDGGGAAADTVPPAPVNDLSAVAVSDTGVQLSWTAPGDDGNTGTASLYDVRYAATPIRNQAAFAAATPLTGEPVPAAAGQSELFDVTGLVANRSYFFALLTSDEVPNVSDLSNSPGATTAPSGSGGGGVDHLVISEVQVKGDGGDPHNDEFVEIHNPTADPVSLAGWSLQYTSASGTNYLTEALSGSVPAGGYFLVTSSNYNGAVAADLVETAFALGSSGGNLHLVQGTSPLSSCGGAGTIDRVAWGSGNCPESSAAAAPDFNGSIERRPGASDPSCGNGTDTDDNSLDFDLRAGADPQNTASTPESCSSALGNVGLTLWLSPGTDLTWGAAYGASGYKVRRAASPDFMLTNPIPDDTHLLASPGGTQYQDTTAPAAGTCWYYFVNATGGGSESVEDTAPW